jgi:hypothetical protein
MVNQVKVVSILMIVQGSLASLMGLLYTFLGPVMFGLMASAPQNPNDPPKGFFAIISGVYIAIGLAVLTCGILNIVGGIRAIKFRNRTLAIVALFTNVIPLLTCYCAPTALGTMIYGLIVFFNNDVAKAFEMVAAGHDPEDVVARFEHRGRWDYDEEEYRRPRRERDDEEDKERSWGLDDRDEDQGKFRG